MLLESQFADMPRAYVSMRRHTSAYANFICGCYQTHALKEAVGIHALKVPLAYAGVCVCIRQHTKHIKRMRLKRQSGYML
jgi:hypothetical protein